MSKWMKKDCITIQGAANRIKVKRELVERWIEDGKIEEKDGYIQIKTVDMIIFEKEKHISLESYLKEIKCEKFDAKYVSNRNKFIDYLEENNFWGLEVLYPEEIRFSSEPNASFYFKVEDKPIIDKESELFFKYYGLSEEEKCQALIVDCKFEKTSEILQNYLQTVKSYTPSVTDFVNKVVQIDILKLSDDEGLKVLNALTYVASKDLFIGFMDYVKQKLSIKLGDFSRKQSKTKKENGAYPYKTYLCIAKNIFNEDIIKKNKIIEKCMSNSYDFEAWLFISIHFVCGWRAGDICNEWPYISKNLVNKVGLKEDELKERIINREIDEKTYFEIGKFIEEKIELAATKPHKTSMASDLLAPIGKKMKIFFGRMALISYYHYSHTNEGMLIRGRVAEYLNQQRIRNIFGDEIYSMMGRRNLSSRRLNKSYLQSIEARARQNGAGTMAAYTIASYARNHADIDTCAIYMFDHGLDGETAEVVLSMMLDRGVFGAIRYKELLAAFPNAFQKLTAKEQTLLLAECEATSYELEMIASDVIEAEALKKTFGEGNKDKTLEILNEMFEISQGFGRGKDYGIHCKKRALGIACENPVFESCLANNCPYLVFTESGIKSLIHVIYGYKTKYEKTRNPKYKHILEDVIMPEYKEIMNELKNRMTTTETEALKKAIGEYNGKHIKNN